MACRVASSVREPLVNLSKGTNEIDNHRLRVDVVEKGQTQRRGDSPRQAREDEAGEDAEAEREGGEARAGLRQREAEQIEVISHEKVSC